MERRGNFLPSTATGAGAAAKSLPVPSPAAAGDAAANLTSSSGSSSSLTLSPPNFLRQVHAAFKRHRPLGTMQSNFPRATRVLVSRGDLPKSTSASPSTAHHPEGKDVQQHGRLPGGSKLRNAAIDRKKDGDAVGLVVSSSDGLSLTPPSILGTITDADDQNAGHSNMQKNEIDLMVDRKKSALEVSSSQMASESALVEGDFKKDRFYAAADAQITSQSDCVGGTVDSRMDSISYLHSLSLTAGDSYAAAQVANDQDGKHQYREKVDAIGMDIKYNAANLPHRGVEEARNPHHGELVTRCSAIGSSITTLSLHSGPTVQSTRGAQHGQYGLPTQMSECAMESSSGMPVHGPPKQHGAAMSAGDWNSNNQQVCNLADVAMEKAVTGNAGGLPSQGLSANNQSLSAGDQGASQPNKGEKERRKKNYNPDVFFKVNGKLYQKLGKIGSGGSSEVHKVISAECTIYALKKIKLKGRDYPTAYGFCQEIEYLNKLKGKTNIIQLIDYEVTDKQLLQEGSTSPRDGRIKDDHYIYMVLEYGEIDLAHMVSLKWKEMNNTSRQIDENWLRFYWQQMLEAVNTIHEERIVHSDLKPANFLLVRGSLKLIDFGIAKAIMNDTTNIQRDAQVGTLNYMSPEAFMCNEQDTGGNIIKCGRPSDIWSLGCILYQMVYGKTPFADYKTFWAKFKVVTDRNHKIHYEPVANPWLIDLMQRCLAWDRNERWRIPQLLQHPFLVPLAPRDLPAIGHDPCKSLMERVRLHWDNPKVSKLCSELHTVITELEADQGVSTTKMEQET